MTPREILKFVWGEKYTNELYEKNEIRTKERDEIEALERAEFLVKRERESFLNEQEETNRQLKVNL